MEKFVVIEDMGGHDGAANGGHYGVWAEVISSRKEIVSVEVVKEDHYAQTGHRLNNHHDYKEVKITVHEEMMRPEDYVLIRHVNRPQPGLNGSSRSERYRLVAGRMPAWADFPGAWRDWVYQIDEEAILHLKKVAGKNAELLEAIEYAERKSAKNKIASAWEDVQKLMAEAGLLKYEPNHSYTWTGVTAMPVKLAKACRVKWIPSIPQPRYGEKKEGEGIVVVAPDWRCPVRS